MQQKARKTTQSISKNTRKITLNPKDFRTVKMLLVFVRFHNIIEQQFKSRCQFQKAEIKIFREKNPK